MHRASVRACCRDFVVKFLRCAVLALHMREGDGVADAHRSIVERNLKASLDFFDGELIAPCERTSGNFESGSLAVSLIRTPSRFDDD